MSERINLLSPEIKADPYPAYAEMRRRAPVCQVDPGGMWAVSRYEDVMYVLKNPRLFSSQGFRVTVNPPWLGGNPFADSMISMDPPDHGRLRGIITRAFLAPTIARLEPRVRAFAEEAAEALPLDQPVDLFPPYALRIPAQVIGEMMGLPPAMHGHLKRWADLITGGVSTVRPDEHDRKQLARDAVAELRGYFAEVLEQRRRALAGDLVSDLLRARVDGESLTQDELIAFMALLLVAGIETAVNLIGASIVILLDRPDLWARLRADRAQIPAFVDEVLRYEPPAQAAPRIVTEELTLAGVRLPQGAPLLAMIASAARDEACFPEGDRFDMDRPGPQNLPFGHGIHFCLGAQVARMEGRLALEALLDRCSHLTRGPTPAVWHRSLIVRGPASVPVVLHRA